MIRDLYKNRGLVLDLALNDFKTKYAGSYLGIIWAFVQPIATIIIYWIVFQYGLRIGSPMEDIPYILWFITGLVPWFFFSEAVSTGTNCLIEYNYLVKKLVFKVSILPVVKVISAFFVHLVFLAFLLLVYSFYGRLFTIKYLLILYFCIAMFILIVGICYFTSATIVFFRDLGQIINIVLQVGMWATPILWDYNIIPDQYLWIMKLNPMFYITEGYRAAFLNEKAIVLLNFQTLYFWLITLLLFIIGTFVFNKMNRHFADVL
jgi:teichoic acid transport system permease protein